MKEDILTEEIHGFIDSEKDALLSNLKNYINFRSINKEQLLEGEKSEISECQKWLKSKLEDLFRYKGERSIDPYMQPLQDNMASEKP